MFNLCEDAVILLISCLICAVTYYINQRERPIINYSVAVTCRVDHDCFLGHICLHNMCIFGCHSDEDCSASETCRDNRCTNPCHSSPCGPNAVCAVTNHRATCSCRLGLVPNPTAQVT